MRENENIHNLIRNSYNGRVGSYIFIYIVVANAKGYEQIINIICKYLKI